MPKVDPNSVTILQPTGPQVQPQPFPGAVTVPVIPRQQQQYDSTAQAMGIAQQANQRAAEALNLQQQSNNRENVNQGYKVRTLDANGGVDTQASQDQAVGHEIMLANSIATIKDIMANAPDQVKPRLKEYGASLFTGKDSDLLAAVQPEQRQRAANAFRSAVESAIWLSTGAAAPQEQVDRIYSTIAPGPFDKPGLLADKRRNLLAYIEQAKVRAGPANVKAIAALDELAKDTGMIFGEANEASLTQDPNNEKVISTESKTVKLPQGYREEEAAYRLEHPQLDPKAYYEFRKGLDEKYHDELLKLAPDTGGFRTDPTTIDDFVKQVNAGYKVQGMTDPSVPMSETEKSNAKVADSAIGAGFAGAADGLLGGTLSLISDPEKVKLMRDNHGTAMAVGEVAGSVPTVLGGEAAAAQLLKKLGVRPGTRAYRLGADLLANTSYGALDESNKAGGDLGAAAEGALGGFGSTLAGRGIAKGFEEFKPKSFQDSIKLLDPEDIVDPVTGEVVGKTRATDMTTFQRAGAGGSEEFFQGLPGVSGQRQNAVASWNLANSSRVLARIGKKLPKGVEAGQEANSVVSKELSNYYDTLKPQIGGKVDAGFTNLVKNLEAKATARNNPAQNEMWGELQDIVDEFVKGGKYDAESYREFNQSMRRMSEHWVTGKGTGEAPSVAMLKFSRYADEMRKEATAMIARKNPELGKKLSAVDGAWAHQARINRASRGAAKQERGVYAPSEYLNAVEMLDNSKDKAAIARGEGFDQQFGQAGQEVLGAKPAKGGSLRETAIGGYLAGAAASPIIVPTAIMAYAPGVKRFSQLIVSGKLGKSADKIMKFLPKDHPLRELPSDVLKQVIASSLRGEVVSLADGEK